MSRKRQQSECNLSKNMKYQITDEVMKENISPHLNKILLQHDNEINMQNATTNNRNENTTPKKSKSAEEPNTPNTNFKMFTSVAATLEYANCSTPKSSKNYEIFDHSNISEPSCKVNRKEKSLAIICMRFLSMYPIYPTSNEKIIVSLDEACINLGVERRRLYDIVNIFESIDILKRNAKNQYLWFGKNNLLNSLQKLKAIAVKENMFEKLMCALKSECLSSCKQSCILNDVQNFNIYDNQDSLLSMNTTPELRKEKSLGIMSQKFLMLFLISPEKIISLGVAAKVLNGFFQKNQKGTQIKTQIRRLYDIANVLSSIGLIQKEVALAHHIRKPAFKYIGPNLDDCKGEMKQSIVKQNVCGNKNRNLTRHSSFQEICAVAEIEHKKLNLRETHNSAPPFDSSVNDTKVNTKTNFKDLQLNDSCEKNTNSDALGINMDKAQIQIGLKAVNFEKSAVNPIMPCYILNNVTTQKDMKNFKSFYKPPAYYLINTITPANLSKKEVPQNQPIIPISSSQTILLSSDQRNAILQYLNISLSSQQIAAIHIDGSSNSNSKSNVLKIINKNGTSQDKIDSQIFTQNTELVSNDLLNVQSMKGNSPNNVQIVASPVSIPSGYATPIPVVATDMSFVSTVEVNDILKKIENQTNCNEIKEDIISVNQDDAKMSNNSRILTSNVNILPKTVTKEKLVDNNQYLVNNMSNNEIIHSINQMNPLISSDSCSNDSINLEISNIFKEKKIGDISSNSFLIDEKTVLSPIKKFNALSDNESSNMTMSSYTVPNKIFVYSASPFGYENAKANDVSTFRSSVTNLVTLNKKILPYKLNN